MTSVRSIAAIASDLRSNAVKGGTVSVLSDDLTPSTGYVVGQHGISGPSETLDFEGWVRSVLPEVAFQPAHYVGVWEEDGVTYLDVVRIHQDRRAALDDALARGEIAIYDLTESECIHLADTFTRA